MKKRFHSVLIAVIALPLFSINSPAQDIEGICLGDKLTKEQMIQKFGKPQKYESGYDELIADYELFKYSGMSILTQSDICVEFNCTQKGITLFSSVVDGGIQIGDSFEETLKGNLSKHLTYYYDRYIERFHSQQYVYLWTDNLDWYIHFYVDNGTIVWIHAEIKL